MTQAELEALAVVALKAVVRQIEAGLLASTYGDALNLDPHEIDTLEGFVLQKRDAMENAVTLW